MIYLTFTFAGVSISFPPFWLVVLLGVAVVLIAIIFEWAIKELINFFVSTKAELIKRIFTIVKVMEKNLAKKFGDSYEEIKRKIKTPDSEFYKFWLKFKGFMKELSVESNEVFRQIPPDAWINKKDDKTKDTAKLEDLVNDSPSLMKTELGEMIEPANFVSTENQEEKEDTTEDGYDTILAKLDTVTEIRKSQLASKRQKKIRDQHYTILAKLVVLMDEKEKNKSLIPDEKEKNPDKNQSKDLVIKRASEIIAISQGQRIKKAKDTIEKLQQAVNLAIRSIEKKTIPLGDDFFRYYLHLRFFKKRRKV